MTYFFKDAHPACYVDQCSGEDCIPGFAPIPNLHMVMRGYDPIRAMPFKNDDTGYRGQIFQPMTQGPDGRSEKEFFWQAYPAECDLTMSTKLVRNFRTYVNEIDRYKFYVSNGSETAATQLQLLNKIARFNVHNVGL